MKVKELFAFFDRLAPLKSQAEWDNGGVQVGDLNTEVKGVLVALDITPEIVAEAKTKGVNVIITHHPLIFKGLKSITGKSYVERVIIECIKNDITVLSFHTNLDHYINGVNKVLGEKMGLSNLKVLQPSTNVLLQLTYFVPESNDALVKEAIFKAGAGQIGNYQECSFTEDGIGSFRPNDNANPFEGKKNELSKVQEKKVTVLISSHHKASILKALFEAHPYEEVAYFLTKIENQNQEEGSGMIGTLESPQKVEYFFNHLKKVFDLKVIRHTSLIKTEIKTVAFCGGSGSFLLKDALASNADVFVTGDYKYHDFFDAENRIIIADIGHFESEQFTINLIADVLKKNFPNFAIHLTGIKTNPINYF